MYRIEKTYLNNLMIKILLKHLIYEKCIDVIINQIALNFSDAKRELIEELHLKRKRDVEQFLRVFPALYKSIGIPTFTPNQIIISERYKK